MLRVKESEVQYLKQEINSLKDELQAAQRVTFLLFFSPRGSFQTKTSTNLLVSKHEYVNFI